MLLAQPKTRRIDAMTHIRIGDTAPRVAYIAILGQTDFPFTFPVFQSADLKVAINEVQLDSGYSVIGGTETNIQGLATDARVVLDTPSSADDRITIWRETAVLRTSDYSESGDLRANTLNTDLDRLTVYAQEQNERANRALSLAPGEFNTKIGYLPRANQRADKILAFDTAGDPVVSKTSLPVFESQAETVAAHAKFVSEAAQTVASDKAGAESARNDAQAAVQGVRVSPNDTTPGSLEEKIAVGNGLLVSTQNEGGNEIRLIEPDIASLSFPVFRNRIINGAFPYVNQRGDQTGVSSSGTYFADRWSINKASGAVVNLTSTNPSLEIAVTAADTTTAAGHHYSLRQVVEGYNIRDLYAGTAQAKTITISFKHRHTKTGTYCVSVMNGAWDRSYVFEYTQTVSDADETHAETLTLDTTGTWLSDSGSGLELHFCLAGGSDHQTTANAWQSGNFLCTANQVNSVDSTSNFFRVHEVQLEAGSVATPFEHRPLIEPWLCYRYYQRQLMLIITSGWTANHNDHNIHVPMRVNPTVSYIPDAGSGGVFATWGWGEFLSFSVYQLTAHSSQNGTQVFLNSEFI